MKYLESDIIDFICGHGGIYANYHGVSMATGINNNLLVATQFRKGGVGVEESLEYFINEQTIRDFILDFEIRKVDDLAHIRPGLLSNLYETGKALLVCDIGDPDTYPLSFRKIGNRMIVIDKTNNVHPLPNILTTPNEFIQHTRYYFEFM